MTGGAADGTTRGVALVTGAGSGIGRATARRLAADGWPIVLVDRDGGRLKDTVDGIGAPVLEHLVCDLTAPSAIQDEIAAVVDRLPVGLLVNNAGVGFRATAGATTDEQWDTTLALNLTAVFRLCRLVLPGMIQRQRGCIVNIASAGGLVGLRQRAAYCASKAGVIGLTRALAADHAADGVRVNAIAPGTVDTEWVERMLADDPDAPGTRRMMEQRQLDGRMGTPDEVAAGVSFLAGPDGRFANGSVLVLDSGLTAV
ncbi:SDR family oxidoreductase [Asanoa sp. NPDC049573]|uniref:SDR family NAD(P)-dependent oxidoreductase n=1 Tax=Asanoa sp. NPDC049573 TaxID=3155396 RepID=UPI00341724BA